MRQARRAKDHRANRLLAALDPDDFACLEPHLEIVDLRRGAAIYDTGDFIRHTYFPHDAIVSLVNVLEDGRTVEVANFGCEGMFGLLSALVTRESFGRYIVHVSGTASRIPFEQLNEIRNTRAGIRQIIMRYSEALLTRTFQILSCNAVHTVEERCCGWILNMQDRIDQDVMPLTHEFLAELLSVQRSTLSAVLGRLQARGLISQRRGAIAVLDRDGLEQAACECHTKIRHVFSRLLPHTYSSR
ncbi:Crp/Fnr family transcriptional regulator [Microvirga sp. KLBC 81]|uniref:Crp/Fnr family transcriptional regulator n=1 Tax=Microvirga sp. KLBC 81 TaxID=1862707 RepID=UPI000D5180E8|nr:Crp/Fnr family transcriptional regulator [Microvirga sp. KLBC 81]PVE25489.1 Crp/Fnr family transcriptional regulator [Microvirga sp. KLBC 81]